MVATPLPMCSAGLSCSAESGSNAFLPNEEPFSLLEYSERVCANENKSKRKARRNTHHCDVDPSDRAIAPSIIDPATDDGPSTAPVGMHRRRQDAKRVSRRGVGLIRRRRRTHCFKLGPSLPFSPPAYFLSTSSIHISVSREWE